MRYMYNLIKELSRKINFEGLSLEQTTFFLISFSGIFMSFVGIVGNLSLGLGIIPIIIPLINIVLDTGCIIYAVKTQKWFIPAILVVFYAIFQIGRAHV